MTTAPSVPPQVLALARSARRITVLTGAGMSAESGVPTFRDPETGLWAKYDPMQIATPQAWYRDKALANAWNLCRVATILAVEPNAGHHALARWASSGTAEIRIVTQNVDDLHERAGSTVMAHLHGSLFSWHCDHCGTPAPMPTPPASPVRRVEPTPCSYCVHGSLRPGVVWFGELLPDEAMAAAEHACREADLALVVGTSGLVYPAAALPYLAQEHGIPVVEIGPESTAFTAQADHVWRATAAEALPALVDAVTAPELADAGA